MYSLLMILIAVSITEIATNNIQSRIRTYFDSQAAKTFDNQWKRHQVPFEYTLSVALQEGYGHKSMNVYLNRFQNPLDVSIGYYHTDNEVQIIFQYMELEELPHVTDVDIVFPLSSNALSVEASVSKMIVRGNYVLFRNKSDIIFSVADQDPFKQSPFRYQQVRNVGNVAISIEGCTLSGILIATLSGGSVNLGHAQLKLTQCEYSLEIYTLGSGAPPVIAQYLPNGETGLSIEHLLMRPLVEELVPKLQASMFSYINTSSLFPKELSTIRAKQEGIFEDTNNYMDQVVRSMNAKSIETNMGTIKLEDFDIVWDDTFEKFPKATAVKLFDLTLMGLDTLYSAHSGGPFRLTETEIAEQLRFSTLEVVGKISIQGFQEDNEFAVEISDLAVNVMFDSNLKPTFEVVGWRFLEFSCPAMEFLPVESFVVGYLLNKIPKNVISHLSSVFHGSGFKLKHDAQDEVFEHEIAADGVKHMGEVNEYNEETLELTMEVSGEDNERVLSLGDDTNNQVKLNSIAETPHEDHGPVKLNHINIVPHKPDDKIVKLSLVEGSPHEHVKLHHIAAVPHEDDHGQVKLHHVNVVADKGEQKIVKLSHGVGSPHEQVKLHHIVAVPHEDDHGKVKLHHVNVVPDKGENEAVKLRLGKAGPYEKVKLQHIATAPHVQGNGSVKLNHKGVVPVKVNSNKAEIGSKMSKSKKSQKRQPRVLTQNSIDRKNNTIKRVNKKLNKIVQTTSSSVNVVDNEIL